MFKISFAQNFVEKVYRQLNYHVNIMNEKGVIIASSDTERIGDFHIIAHRMLKRKQLVHQTDTISDDLLGVKYPGVNLLMMMGNDPIGIIGVSGNPSQVLQVAKTIKFALESMLEYQEQDNEMYWTRNDSSKLTYALLLESPMNPARVTKIAEQIGVRCNCLRFPILITLSGVNACDGIELLIDLYSNRFKADSQDILLPIDKQNALLLLSLPSVYKVEYDTYAQEVVGEISKHLSMRFVSSDCIVRFICGIPQSSLLEFREIFKCMSWLKSQKYHHVFDVIYLRDYFIEYSVSQIDAKLLNSFFAYYTDLIKDSLEVDMFRDTISAMIESNMKPEVAAAKLYMHKNTVVARMKKIKELLGIQPTTNTKDAAFLVALYEYMTANI